MLTLFTLLRHLMPRASFALLALLVAVTAGCEPVAGDAANSTAAPAAAPATIASAKSSGDIVSAMTDSVNYRYDREIQYTLYDLTQTRPTAVGGAIVEPLATGGEKGCCIALPAKWKQGMKVRVEWGEADRDKIYPEKYSRDLEIPRYDTPGDLYVVFYPGHEVEVVVSAAEPGSPDWRGKIKQTPWQRCVATVGEKACKAVLPKLFDTASAEGFCNYLKDINALDAKDLCQSTMIDCMRDYEDEAFCKKVLWAPGCSGHNKDDPYCIEKTQERKTK